MIRSFIQKHAVLLTAGFVLMAAFSCPYLVPENPDSAIFRSGTLGFILLCACAYPVYQALHCADMRTLSSSMIFGFLFALALSLGSELFVYDGLLPGIGSMLRRLAVPFLATPLLGCLSARLMLLAPKKGALKIPLNTFALILLLCWLPLLFTYFPAALNYDFPGQVGQYLESNYSDSQPMLHTAFAAVMFKLGEKLFSSRTAGLLMMTLVQMVLFAYSLAYACHFVQRHGAPAWVFLLMTGYFALHPLFSVMAISTTKDTLFASAILILSLQSYEIIETGDAFFENRRRVILFISMAVCAALLRSNGLVCLLVTLPSLFLVRKSIRKKIFLLGVGCIAATLTISASINLVFSPSDMSIHQSLSLPAQQLVRAYNSTNLSEEEKDEISSWYLSDIGLILHPFLADGAKGYLNDDRLEKDMGSFIVLWAKTFAKCPREYIEAFLMLNIGSWYPDDLTHSTIYRDASYVDKGYLQTIEYDMSEYGIHTYTFLPSLHAFYESVCRANLYQKYPISSHLFSTALPFWGVLFAACLLIARGRSRYLPATLCSISLWASYLFFGPCTLARYVLPLFLCAPTLLSAAFFHEENHP